jgi:hypothetical protein
MAERKSARLRLIFLGLVAANLLVFTLLKVRTDPNEAAAMRIEEVQINAESVKLLGAATRGAGQAAAGTNPSGGAKPACLEWGPVSREDAAAAAGALEKLALTHPPVRRPASDSGEAERFVYYLRDPDSATVAQIAELRRAFPGTRIRAGTCPDDVAGAPGSGDRPR